MFGLIDIIHNNSRSPDKAEQENNLHLWEEDILPGGYVLRRFT